MKQEKTTKRSHMRHPLGELNHENNICLCGKTFGNNRLTSLSYHYIKECFSEMPEKIDEIQKLWEQGELTLEHFQKLKEQIKNNLNSI